MTSPTSHFQSATGDCTERDYTCMPSGHLSPLLTIHLPVYSERSLTLPSGHQLWFKRFTHGTLYIRFVELLTYCQHMQVNNVTSLRCHVHNCVTTFTQVFGGAVRHRAVRCRAVPCLIQVYLIDAVQMRWRAASQLAGHSTSDRWHSNFQHSAYYSPFPINFLHFAFRKLPSAVRKLQFTNSHRSCTASRVTTARFCLYTTSVYNKPITVLTICKFMCSLHKWCWMRIIWTLWLWWRNQLPTDALWWTSWRMQGIKFVRPLKRCSTRHLRTTSLRLTKGSLFTHWWQQSACTI